MSTSATGEPLLSRYRAVVCDLDGVVYRGHLQVPYAVPALQAAASGQVRVVFATNNASRGSAVVADQLRALGLSATADDVLTSSQAGAAEVLARVGPGSRVLAVGGPGVAEALVQAGLTALRLERGPDGVGIPVNDVAAVLQGYGADVSWHELAEVAYAVTAGAVWVATNDDGSLPTSRGLAPGNGALVGAVRRAVTVDPVVVGKPHPPLYRLAAALAGAEVRQTLAIGDRLDTDIAGAVATTMDSLHVLTGVDGVAAVSAAPVGYRPTYLGWDLRVLSERYEQPVVDRYSSDGDVTSTCGAAVVRWPREADPQIVDGGSANEEMRAVVAACWAQIDNGGNERVSRAPWARLLHRWERRLDSDG